MNAARPYPVVLGITGASGAVYAQRLLEVLVASGRDVHLVVSPSAQLVFREELGIALSFEAGAGDACVAALLRGTSVDPVVAASATGGAGTWGVIRWHHHQNFLAPIASGSFLTSGMVICPCSGGTLSGVVNAASGNLIQRAADVHLKERRKLIVVPRETPLSIPQLDNLKRAAEAGAIVLPAMPGWYHGVRSVRDLVDFIVARILDQLGVEHRLMKRWGTEASDGSSPEAGEAGGATC